MKRISYSDLHYDDEFGIYYYDGKPFTGLVFNIDEKGNLISEREYRDGMGWGAGRSWFQSGSLASEDKSAWGVYDGLRHEWHENGVLAAEEMYEHGIRVYGKKWDSQGKQIEEFRLTKSDPNYKTLQVMRSHYKNDEKAESDRREPEFFEAFDQFLDRRTKGR